MSESDNQILAMFAEGLLSCQLTQNLLQHIASSTTCMLGKFAFIFPNISMSF